jgi:methylated-DNA-[protein]-cysteine S-methyltransferase
MTGIFKQCSDGAFGEPRAIEGDRMIRYRTIDSPIGPLTLAGRGHVLTNLRMADQAHEPDCADWLFDDQAFPEVVDQLREYFAGERTDFDVELSMAGTEFQLRVWQALRTIPYGETRSYGELAEQIGAAGAARAIGLANGRNPIAIIVPCHRVLGANGGLIGYGGGLDRKQVLLDLERHTKSAELPLFDRPSYAVAAGGGVDARRIRPQS